jgi:hypothetical protein
MGISAIETIVDQHILSGFWEQRRGDRHVAEQSGVSQLGQGKLYMRILRI